MPLLQEGLPGWAAVALAVAALLAAAGLLRAGGGPSVAGGLALAASALGLLAATIGWGVGVPVWLGLLSLAGFLTALVPGIAERRGAAPAPARPGRRSSGGALRPTALTAAALAGGLALSVALGLALSRQLPIPPVDRALLAVVLWPALWAAGAMLLGAARRPWRDWSIAAALGGMAVLVALTG